ncbi:hypothetical protein FRX31_024169, partial [Thalictrum thalictroides]
MGVFFQQIELDEYEGISLLAATLAWDGHSTFDKAIHSFKLSLSQQDYPSSISAICMNRNPSSQLFSGQIIHNPFALIRNK